MSELKSIHDWYDYNALARQAYIDVLAKLPPEELKRDRGASFPTLVDILTHSMGGIETWVVRMSALNGEPFPHYEGPDDMSLDDVRKYDQKVRKDVAEFFSRLKEGDLDRSYLVPKLPPWWDEDFTTTIRGTLLHVIEHELQHRGELNALLWQIDVEPPILDWDEFERVRARSPAGKH